MLEGLVLAARDTVIDARAGAQRVIALRLPLGTAVLALLLTSVLAAVLAALTFLASGMGDDPAIAALFGSPFGLALMQVAVQGVAAFLIFFIGRLFGGRGALSDAVALMAWLEAVLLLAQLAQLVLILALPLLAELLGLMAMGLFLWLLTVFTAELHGFRRLGMVFLGILATALAVGVLFVGILGISPGG
jgi:hypothetical protein